jgi:2-keto-4-pentenoate hydratase
MSYPTSELAADARVRRGLRAQLAERERVLAGGAEPLGWKLGFGAPESMERLGTTAPLIGFMTSRSRIQAGSVSVSGWANPLVEPEIAIRVDADEGGTRVAGFAPALELADLDPPPDEVEAILAGNVFHRGVILGPGRSGGVGEIASLRAEVEINGERTVVDDPQAATGEVASLLAHVADLLVEFGLALRPGEIVICGSLVPPIPVSPGDSVSYRLADLGALHARIEDAAETR